MESVSGQVATTARVESFSAVFFLFVVGTVIAAVDLGARNKDLALWMDRERLGRVRAAGTIFRHNGFYETWGDQMLLEDLAVADYSKGGAFLIGASSLAVATRLWDLPSEQKALIHNYSQAGSCHLQHFHIVKYLVERENLLQAGAGNTLVILGVGYYSASCLLGPDDGFVETAQRYGMYTYDRHRGLQPVVMHPALRWIRTERARFPGFLRMCREFLYAHALQQAGIDPAPRRVHHPKEYNTWSRRFIGSDWERKFSGQIDVLGEMFYYLRAHGVEVVVVILPMASWEDELPYEEWYNGALTALCRAKRVPLYDWSRMLDDEKFGDVNHVNIEGMEKLYAALLEIAVPFLKKTGALP